MVTNTFSPEATDSLVAFLASIENCASKYLLRSGAFGEKVNDVFIIYVQPLYLMSIPTFRKQASRM